MPDNTRLRTCTITIDRLRLHCHHGVAPQEQKVGNWFEVTAVMEIPVEKVAGALCSDDVSATVNYAEASQVIDRTMAIPSKLLEHAAMRIVEALTRQFPIISALTVTVVKPVPPMGMSCSGASVTLTWKA